MDILIQKGSLSMKNSKEKKEAKAFLKKNFDNFKKKERENIRSQICINYATKEMMYNGKPIEESSFFDDILDIRETDFCKKIKNVKVKKGEKWVDMLNIMNNIYREAILYYAETELNISRREMQKYINYYSLDVYYVPMDRILNAMSENPYIQGVSYFQLKKDVNERVPENLADLFPGARNINRHFVLHVGDTNSGKTHDAIEEFMRHEKGTYLAPLRLLAMEIQEKSNDNLIPCSLLTGEEEEFIEDATHISSTIEMVNLRECYDIAVIDEAQMIADKDRGWAWTQAILGVKADKIHVCMSEDAQNIVIQLIQECGDTYEVIRHERNTPLIFKKKIFSFPKDVREHDALIVFSRKNVLHVAGLLRKQGIEPSMIYGALPYDVRKHEVEKFLNGETKVVVATDAIGMGMNLPIKRIVFLEDEKYDGTQTRFLYGPEVKQIAGRAGRKGMYEEGYVQAAENGQHIQNMLNVPYEPIKTARVRMPEELLNLDDTLKHIILLWEQCQNKDFYKKTDIRETLSKLYFLEDYLKKRPMYDLTKTQIWSFINVPVDTENYTMMEIWQTLIDRYCKKKSFLEELQKIYTHTFQDLESLETMYRIFDLFFAFQRAAKVEEEGLKEYIIREKNVLSKKIIKKLGEQQFVRKCKDCGKVLPFTTHYAICEKCYSKRYNYNNEYWY